MASKLKANLKGMTNIKVDLNSDDVNSNEINNNEPHEDANNEIHNEVNNENEINKPIEVDKVPDEVAFVKKDKLARTPPSNAFI
jgi:hypothetical protein